MQAQSSIAARRACLCDQNVQEPDPCPADPEEVAEAYIRGTLPQDQLIAFEHHYVACPKCAKVLQKTAEYVAAMRAATTKLCSGPGGGG